MSALTKLKSRSKTVKRFVYVTKYTWLKVLLVRPVNWGQTERFQAYHSFLLGQYSLWARQLKLSLSNSPLQLVFMPGTNRATEKRLRNRKGLSWVTAMVGGHINSPPFFFSLLQDNETLCYCAGFAKRRCPPVIYECILRVARPSPYIWHSL